jgi:hypothetical protein
VVTTLQKASYLMVLRLIHDCIETIVNLNMKKWEFEDIYKAFPDEEQPSLPISEIMVRFH